MKSLLIFSITISLVICTSETHAQVYGNADIFTYNSAGQRILRYYGYTIIAPKQGNNEEHPVDTLTQKFDKKDIAVRAYPNPTADEMIVENLAWKDEYKVTVKIFDITGKAIQSRAFSSAKERFSLAGLAPGTYQVQYYLNQQLLTTWKIVKK